MPVKKSKPANVDYYDVFDSSIRRYLRAKIIDIGLEYQQVEPLINPCMRLAKQKLRSMKQKLTDTQIKLTLSSLAFGNLQLILSQREKFSKVKEIIKSYGCFMVVGAGASYGSDAPLANNLEPIFRFCGVSGFADLSSDNEKALCFKKQFKKVCLRKGPSVSHKLIAKNFSNYILEILSLNWDDFIEKAMTDLKIGFNKVNKQDDLVNGGKNLWKFHGDVDLITTDNIPGSGGWVFTENKGFVFQNFKEYATNGILKEELYAILTIGYSGKDKVINEEVIKNLKDQDRRELFRISMSPEHLSKPDILVGTSDYVLSMVMPDDNI